MKPLTEYPNKLDREKRQCKVIIETPKGRRNKFDYEPDFGLFELGGVLPEGMYFPYDFGFIPSTLGEDGDPLDVLVIMDEPAHVGCLIDVRIVGVIEAEQTEHGKTNRNDRLIGVAVHSHNHQDATAIEQIPEARLKEIEEFFAAYNKARGKEFKVKRRGGPDRAVELIEKGVRAYRKR